MPPPRQRREETGLLGHEPPPSSTAISAAGIDVDGTPSPGEASRTARGRAAAIGCLLDHRPPAPARLGSRGRPVHVSRPPPTAGPTPVGTPPPRRGRGRRSATTGAPPHSEGDD